MQAQGASDSPVWLIDGGRARLDLRARQLWIGDQLARLGGRAFDLLQVLVENRDRVMPKRELMDLVWPDVVVEEGNLPVHAMALRKLLGASALVTVPGRGYRFTLPVQAAVDEHAEGSARAQPAPASDDACAAPLAAPAGGQAAPDLPALRTNLPARMAPLLGRDDALVALQALVARHPLVTVVGTAGIGKTRLVQAFLHGHRDDLATWRHGVCWVELSTVTDADAVPAKVAAALGVRVGGGDALASLCEALQPLRVLIALDNAEQVLDAVARLAHALLDAAPGVRLIATSQAPLRLQAEQVYRLDALAVPAELPTAAEAVRHGAIALFVERAQAADPRFVLNDANVAAVVEVCRALDGLPLALELAAARAPLLGMRQLAKAMGDRLKLLSTSRDRSAPARHQTLRAALAWSHGFLDAQEQAVFRRLAVFAGSTSLAMAQRVLADPPGAGALDEWAVLDALAVLVERSLVGMVEVDGADPRYRLLDTPRLFALERLVDAGEHASLRSRHAQAVADSFEAAHERRFDGSIGERDWLRQVEPDLDNAREALAWAREAGDDLTLFRIAPAFVRALPRSAMAEHMAVAERIENRAADPVPLAAQVRALTACRVAFSNLDPQRTRRISERAADLALRLPGSPADERLHYLALCSLASAASILSDDAVVGAALARARALEDPTWPPQLLFFGADAQARANRTNAGFLAAMRQVMRLGEASGGDPAAWLPNLVDAELAAGHAAEAAALGMRLLEQGQHSRLEWEMVVARANTTAAWLALGDCRQARAVAMPGWARAPGLRLQYGFADSLALLAALEGRPEDAAQLIGYADAVWARQGVDREPNEARACERAGMVARDTLGDVAFERLRDEGRLLRDEQVAAIAFAALPP